VSKKSSRDSGIDFMGFFRNGGGMILNGVKNWSGGFPSNYRSRVARVVCGLSLIAAPHFFKALAEDWNEADLMPKALLGADRFLLEHPEADGRGIRIAIWDQGVSLGAPGLQWTSTGSPKIVQVWDATGSDRIPLTDPVKPDGDHHLIGVSGRELTLPSDCEIQANGVRLGARAMFEYFPGSLNSRLRRTQDDRMNWDRDQQMDTWEGRIEELESDASKNKDEIDRLKTLIESFKKLSNYLKEPGPVFDVIVYRGKNGWEARVDTDEDGDLAEEKALNNYRYFQEYASFGGEALINFAAEIEDTGKWVDVIVESGTHGSHVAGITSANYPDHPEKNGLAPGAEIVSIKIGDPRLTGMETGRALIKAMELTRQAGCDMINFSYGEATTLPNQGELTRSLAEFVRETGIYFVSSTGNEGPGLSTAGAPGGTTSEIIGIGAWAPRNLKSSAYSLPAPGVSQMYSFSSRGPNDDGAWGVDWIAPGGAYASYPNWTLEPRHLANGTSMASPNFCGSLALLLSALKAESDLPERHIVLRALANTSSEPQYYNRADMGHGAPDLPAAYEYLTNLSASDLEEPEYKIGVTQPEKGRGILLRSDWYAQQSSSWTVRVGLEGMQDWTPAERAAFERRLILKPSASWIQCADRLLIHEDGRSFEVAVNPQKVAPGFYDEVIEGWIADRPELGAVFSVPVALYRPESLNQGRWSGEIEVAPGALKRLIFDPPHHAAWVKWRFESSAPTTTSSQILVSHWTQPLPQLRLTHRESNQSAQIIVGESVEGSFQLPSDSAFAEWTIGPGWKETETLTGKLVVEFGGATPSHQKLAGAVSDSWIHLWAQQSARPGKIQPSGKISHFSRFVQPEKASLTSTDEFGKSRNRSNHSDYPDRPKYHRLILDYSIKSLAGYNSWEPHWDGFEDRIYESDAVGFLWKLMDRNGQVLRVDDMWPSLISDLKDESYQLQLEVISAEKSWLESMKEMPCRIEWRLKKSQDLKAATDPNAALKGQSNFGSQTVSPGSVTPIYCVLPKSETRQTEALQPGDLLTGSFKIESDGRSYPVQLAWTQPALNSSSEKVSGRAVGADQPPYLDDIPESLTQRKQLVALFEKDQLKNRKQNLQSIIETLEEALDPDCDWKEKINSDLWKKLQVDLLYRRARAYAYLDLARDSKDPELKQIAEAIDAQWTREAVDEKFESAYQALDQEVEPSDSDYALVYIRREWRNGRHANVLKTLLRLADEQPSSYLIQNKLLKVLRDLDWSDWERRQYNSLFRKFPNRDASKFGW